MVTSQEGLLTSANGVGAESGFRRFAHAPAWHLGVLAVLMLIQVVCAASSSTASTDTNRDIYFAEQIASAREFPLVGPEINHMLHLGPIWFYVLAVAAWLIPNAAAVTAFMAAIGALQFPLAYRLGCRFGSAREGILFALALALPGFMAVSLVSLTHTIAVIPCLLMAVFVALAYRARADWKRAVGFGVICALLLHAHPTTLLLAVALALWCAQKTPRPREWLTHGLIVLVPIALSFAPMLYAQWRDGFADVAATGAYVHETWNVPSLSDGIFLLYATLYNGPKYMAHFWLDMPPLPARTLLSIYVAVLSTAGFGLVWQLVERTRRRKLIAVLLGLLILQSTFVCAIRSDMPPWMIYAQWPLIAALLALGLERICKAGKWGLRFISAGLVVTTFWSVAIWVHMAAGGLDFVEMKAAPGKAPLMADVREYSKDRLFFRMPRLPFRQFFAIGQSLCEPVTLFGHYAYLIDISYGIGAIERCGDRKNIQLGGPADPRRELRVGLREEAWQQLEMKPKRRVGVLGISTPEAIWSSVQPLYPETPRLSTWPHQINATARRFTIEGEAPADQAVLIAHRANRYLPFSVVVAKANGIEIKPTYADLMTAAYRVPAGFSTGTVRWWIEVEGAREYVDALTFASSH